MAEMSAGLANCFCGQPVLKPPLNPSGGQLAGFAGAAARCAKTIEAARSEAANAAAVAEAFKFMIGYRKRNYSGVQHERHRLLAVAVHRGVMYNPQMADSLPRHTALVRATHWITAAAFAALLVTGVEILISHPRFYWGEAGNVGMTPLFQFHIPSSRGTVPTGYSYTLPDQNGWSRYLHFQSAWVAVLTGLLYVAWGLAAGHFRRNLVPKAGSASWSTIAGHLRLRRPGPEEAWTYNPVQRVSYLLVIFILFPLVIWTGLAMSPGFISAVPASVTLLGGQQSARTLHFFVSVALALFALVHVAMVIRAGFGGRMRAMITGRAGRESA